MLDNEWRLLYPGTDYTFGTGATPVYNRTTPDFGDYEIRNADSDRARGDGRTFGADFFGARTISFDLGVGLPGFSETDVRAAVAALAGAWRADAVRSAPGAVAELRSRYRGSERSVFGRPRRFSPNLSEARTGRFVSVQATFDCADERWYSATTSEATVNFAPATGGGLLSPLATPLVSTASSDRSVTMAVRSELPVWPVIEISGPIANPTVEIVGVWKMSFNVTIASDQTLVIDTQPWARTILMSGASYAGDLTPTSVRLADAEISAGNYELAIRGTSSTGTALARLRWRDSFSTP